MSPILPAGTFEGALIATRNKVEKWCKRCGRKHWNKDECDLVLVERKAKKSGSWVIRAMHRATATALGLDYTEIERAENG